MKHIKSVTAAAANALNKTGIDQAWLDAELLLAHVLHKNRAWVLSHPEYRMTASERKRFAALIRFRARRIPLAFLVGAKEFYGLEFRVTPAVLIPRPETEHLIELALPYLKNLPRGSLVADIGTGSGCIVVALATLLPKLRFVATDVSVRALAVARANARRHRVLRRIAFLSDAQFSVLQRPVRAVIANLPYLSEREHAHGMLELRHEPIRALVGGRHGDEVIRSFLKALEQLSSRKKTLRPRFIGIELNPSHALRVAALAKKLLPAWQWGLKNDLAGEPRFLLGVRQAGDP